MSDPIQLLKSKDYSRLVPKHGIDHNGKPYTRWIDPYKHRDQDPQLKGQQALFDLETAEKEHEGKPRGWHDHVEESYHDHVVNPLLDVMEKIDPPIAKRLKWKYDNYIFDHDTKELDLDVDYETAKYLKLKKDAPDYADQHRKEYDSNTLAMKKMINNRKRHMAGKMVNLKKGSELELTGGRKAVLEGFNDNGFPLVKIGGKTDSIFFEEIRYRR